VTARRERGLRRAAAAALVAATAFVCACASAGKRLEQGLDAEARGDWFEAARRYADALEKDPSLEEARRGLLAAGDSAVRLAMRRADDRRDAGDPVGGADALRGADALLARGRAVGAAIPTPEGWAAYRREAFDAASEHLLARGDSLRDQGRWGEARAAYRRIRADFEPDPRIARASLDAEAGLLLAWADAEAADGRWRTAYGRAGEALTVAGPLPADLVDAASALQQEALANGLRVLAIFPVGSTAHAREASDTDLEGQLSDVLELDHWRSPPLFVAVADPVTVRQITRRLFPPGSAFRPGRVLEEVGADFGALIEISKLEVTESDVKSEERTARNSRGRPVTYTVERGRLRYEIEATISIFDERGGGLGSSTARATESGRFERGSYGGSWRDLNLSRGETLLFDPAAQRAQRVETEAKLLAELAEQVADQVFGTVVRRIP